MKNARLTVADLRALRGQRQMSMIYVESVEEADAARQAKIDILVTPSDFFCPEIRDAAGDCFMQVGLAYGQLCTYEDYLRAAHRVMLMGADCVYCTASLDTLSRLASEAIPVTSHLGLVPSQATWTGGFKAVGKTALSAIEIFERAKALEKAGVFGAEIEVVPDRVTAEIAARTGLVLFSMGGGSSGHAQYLFSEDILGCTRGHRPRHAKVYRNFRAEYARLQQERIGAYGEFAADVECGRYPTAEHLVEMADGEYEKFLGFLSAEP